MDTAALWDGSGSGTSSHRNPVVTPSSKQSTLNTRFDGAKNKPRNPKFHRHLLPHCLPPWLWYGSIFLSRLQSRKTLLVIPNPAHGSSVTRLALPGLSRSLNISPRFPTPGTFPLPASKPLGSQSSGFRAPSLPLPVLTHPALGPNTKHSLELHGTPLEQPGIPEAPGVMHRNRSKRRIMCHFCF